MTLRHKGVLVLAVAAMCGCGAPRKPSACDRALARLQTDVRLIRHAADAQRGVGAATDRFLHDLELSPLDQLARNRMIDHAAAALVGSCPSCFQALEADRPIPAITQHGRGAGCSGSS